MNIPKFFKGKSVLITGITGFLGKTVAEKVLRSCPEVEKIFVLARPRGTVRGTRLAAILQSPVFEPLRDEERHSPSINGRKKGSLLTKLVEIPGDLTLPNLGLSPEDTLRLSAEVSIVLHCAAETKFHAPIKVSLSQNVLGTKNMITLAKKMRNLEIFVYVSTAYSNGRRMDVDEKVYDTQMDPNDVLSTVLPMTDNAAEKMTARLLGDMPCTYLFSKSLAEKLVENYYRRENFPGCIVRPAIVAAAYREPFPAWIDNVSGASSMIIAIGSGYVQTWVLDKKCRGNWIPVDYCANVVIAAAACTATERAALTTGGQNVDLPNDIPVFNCPSGMGNPPLWGEIMEHLNQGVYKFPFKNTFWYPNFHCYTSSPTRNSIYQLFLHQLVGQVVDFLRRCLYGPNHPGTKLTKAYQQIKELTNALAFFTTHSWKFSTKNTERLLDKLNCKDRQQFNFDMRTISLAEFFQSCVQGTQRFLLKEGNKNRPNVAGKHEEEADNLDLLERRKKLQRLYVCHLGLKASGALLPIYLIIKFHPAVF